MPISRMFGLTGLAKPLTSEEGRRVLERDRYICQYCGLDGRGSCLVALSEALGRLGPLGDHDLVGVERVHAVEHAAHLVADGAPIFSAES